MSNSENIEVRKQLLEYIRQPRQDHYICDIRDILKKIFTRVKESLKSNDD